MDVEISNQGTIVLMTPLTGEAAAWLGEHLPSDATFLDASVVVEHRFADDIIADMRRDGLAVG
jgi:hypothetical protein